MFAEEVGRVREEEAAEGYAGPEACVSGVVSGCGCGCGE